MSAPLPVEEALPALIEALRTTGRAVLEAPPGAGKTTRVPPAIAAAFPEIGAIWVLEPRRLAARTAARRVAEERGERAGGSVGYRVRFDDQTSAATRIVFATEGLLLERLRNDPDLADVGAIVFDEFHERHLDGDLLLGMCMRLAERRHLMLCVMSATLDAAPIAAHLAAPRVSSEGRLFPIEMRYAPPERTQTLEQAVARAARSCPVRARFAPTSERWRGEAKWTSFPCTVTCRPTHRIARFDAGRARRSSCRRTSPKRR
jgi:ATP-dependent helicase HrpB